MTHPQQRGYHPTELADTALVRRTLEGDASAFTVLAERHAGPCVRYAMRMLGNREDADEVTQDALLRAHRALPRYDERTAFRTWLMSILINRCRTALLHRRRRLARVVADDDAVHRASVDATASRSELRLTIEHALEALDADQREAFLLKHVEQLSYDEMSAATGVGVSALKMRVQRACDRLRILLQEDRHA